MEVLNKNNQLKNIATIALILFISMTSCKKKTESDQSGEGTSLSGVVLFVVGDVKSGTKKIKVGDIIAENEAIQTGKKSTCDLQIQNSDSGIVMRLKADSTFQLNSVVAKGKKTPNAMLSSGSVLVNVSKKLKAEEDFNVVTPTMVAGVRGTKFDIQVLTDGSTSVSVSEGKVATYARILEVDELPAQVQEKSLMIKSVKESLASEEKIIEAGQGTEITKKQTNKILQETGLGTSIKNIQVAKLSNLSEQEIQASATEIDKSFQTDGKSEAIKKSIHENSSSKIRTIGESDLQAKLKEFSELIAIEREKLENTESMTLAVKDRNEQNKEILTKRIEEITGKSFETLLLKSGKKVKGIVFLEGETYYVITHEGQETYKEEEVEGMEL